MTVTTNEAPALSDVAAAKATRPWGRHRGDDTPVAARPLRRDISSPGHEVSAPREAALAKSFQAHTDAGDSVTEWDPRLCTRR
jgi:hypothetical protein